MEKHSSFGWKCSFCQFITSRENGKHGRCSRGERPFLSHCYNRLTGETGENTKRDYIQYKNTEAKLKYEERPQQVSRCRSRSPLKKTESSYPTSRSRSPSRYSKSYNSFSEPTRKRVNSPSRRLKTHSPSSQPSTKHANSPSRRSKPSSYSETRNRSCSPPKKSSSVRSTSETIVRPLSPDGMPVSIEQSTRNVVLEPPKQLIVSYPLDVAANTTTYTVSCEEEESDEEHYVPRNVSSETGFEVDGKEADVLSCPSSYETLSTRKNRPTPADNNNNDMLDSTTSFVSSATKSNNKIAQASEDLHQVIYEKFKLIADNRITLNVGGKCFETSKVTLGHCPGSVLAIMCNARYGYTGEKEVFIDHDPTHFHHILSFLRHEGRYDIQTLPQKKGELLELSRIAVDLRLEDFEIMIRKKIDNL